MCGESCDAYTMSWDESSVIRNTIMEYWNFQGLRKVNRYIFYPAQTRYNSLLNVFLNYAINKSRNLLINAKILIMCRLMYSFFSKNCVCPGQLYVLCKVLQDVFSLNIVTVLHTLAIFLRASFSICFPVSLQNPVHRKRSEAHSLTKGWRNDNGIPTLSACGTQTPPFCYNWTNMSVLLTIWP